MTDGHSERLSALDATFLEIEDDAQHMHVGAVIVFDAKPLTLEHGGLDIDKLRAYIHSAIATIPRYRQRLAFAPVLKHPVWIDDANFNINYHVRHTALPRPGDARQLKRMAGRIFSQQLDRTRPMWEMWVVEGLDDDRFVLITKAHHCMVDGMAGVDLMAALLRMDQSADVPELKPWAPRPAPSGWEMAASEVKQRAVGTKKAWSGLKEIAGAPKAFIEQVKGVAGGVSETLATGLTPASKTPLRMQKKDQSRRFDVVRFDLEQVKEVRRSLGGKLNDVVLATVAGACRRFLTRRGMNPDAIEDFRACVPVAVKSRKSDGVLGNHVSIILARLPVSEPEPRERYSAVVAETERLKAATPERAGEFLADAGEYTSSTLSAQVARVAARVHAFNIVVTNVPGPPFPLYLLGARLEGIYPQVPLFGLQSIALALFSYAGGLFWGLNADWQHVPDLHDFADDLVGAFVELRAAAD